MPHPFAQMFEKALKRSSEQENFVLEEARGLRQKGYSPEEIYEVLAQMHREFLSESDREIIGEVLDEFATYMGE